MLGARNVLAVDFDPECVRITRENTRANNLLSVSVRKLDVLEWEPAESFDLVAANLYSTILTAIASKLARAVAPQGTLIFSGVMREQEDETTDALGKARFNVTHVKRQGKWIAGTAVPRK
jgi:ribosomal protein L11 methyltransferase